MVNRFYGYNPSFGASLYSSKPASDPYIPDSSMLSSSFPRYLRGSDLLSSSHPSTYSASDRVSSLFLKQSEVRRISAGNVAGAAIGASGGNFTAASSRIPGVSAAFDSAGASLKRPTEVYVSKLPNLVLMNTY